MSVYFIFSNVAVPGDIAYDNILLNEQEILLESIDNENEGNYIYSFVNIFEYFLQKERQFNMNL